VVAFAGAGNMPAPRRAGYNGALRKRVVAVLVGSDTSGVECANDPALPGAVNPVHEYLPVEQGVHLGEFHNLEGLAANKVYRFVYVAMTNRLKGTVAGTAMRPIAIE
jgi:hypothetical protein